MVGYDGLLSSCYNLNYLRLTHPTLKEVKEKGVAKGQNLCKNENVSFIMEIQAFNLKNSTILHYQTLYHEPKAFARFSAEIFDFFSSFKTKKLPKIAIAVNSSLAVIWIIF